MQQEIIRELTSDEIAAVSGGLAARSSNPLLTIIDSIVEQRAGSPLERVVNFLMPDQRSMAKVAAPIAERRA
jgi:hypothetical protein